MPRLDAYLKNVGLFARRNDAKRACEDGRVAVSGIVAKPAREPRVGEIVTLDLADVCLEVEIVDIPTRSVARKERSQFVRVLTSRRTSVAEVLSFDFVE